MNVTLDSEQMIDLKHILKNLEMVHRCNITSNLNSDLKTDYSQGLASGMQIANEFYTRHIQELRILFNSLVNQSDEAQILLGKTMIEDVILDGVADEAI